MYTLKRLYKKLYHAYPRCPVEMHNDETNRVLLRRALNI